MVKTNKRTGKCADTDDIDTQRNDGSIIQKGCDQSGGKPTTEQGECQTKQDGCDGCLLDCLAHTLPVLGTVAIGNDGLDTHSNTDL